MPNTSVANAVRAALSAVIDPELRLPITQLGMVDSLDIAEGADGAHVTVRIKLTIPGCPMRERIRSETERAVQEVPGVASTDVAFAVMTDEDRAEVRRVLRERHRKPVSSAVIEERLPDSTDPFAGNEVTAENAAQIAAQIHPHPDHSHGHAQHSHGHDPSKMPFQDGAVKVFAIASGKGGVGKSTVTANLALAMAQAGLSVGVIDADIHGFSLPRMLGTGDQQPTKVDELLLPPVAHGVKVMSIGMFVEPGAAVIWRGPVMHRALMQFLTDVHWGQLDVLLLDLPPGTGDVAISVGQLLPNSQLVLVTTPQIAAAEVAVRAGSMSAQTKQHVAGVVENMAWLDAGGQRLEVFGRGGGQEVADSLSGTLGYEIPLLGQIPIEETVRVGGDTGEPVVLSAPDSTAAKVFTRIAESLTAVD